MGRQTTIYIKPDLKIEQLVKQVITVEEKQVVLEVSEGANLLTNEINLRLLKFYAEEEDKEIIIKTTDPVLISLAQRLEISTVKESELIINREAYYKAEDETAAVPEIPRPKPKHTGLYPGGLLPAILIVIFSLVLALWWFLSPKAVVTVFPKEEEIPFEAIAKIGTIFTNEDIADCKIPAELKSKATSISVQTVTTGHKMIGITPAIGKVTFINSTNQPVVVPKGSVLTAKDGTRFLTDRDVLVPKKTTKYIAGEAVGEDFGMSEVGITAESKGTKGNQPAKAISKLEPKFQNLLKAVNLTPTKNGTDKKVAVVTLEDVKKGEEEAKRQMQLVGPEEIVPLVGSDRLFVRDLIKFEVIRFINKPEIGGEGETLQTILEYQVSVLTVSKTIINQFLVKQLELNLPPNFEASNNIVKMTKVEVAAANDSETKLKIFGKGKIRGILNIAKVKGLILGKTVSEAEKLLFAQPEIGDLKINLQGRKSKLPEFGFQIKIVMPGGNK